VSSRPSSSRFALPVGLVGTFMAIIDVTMVVVAIPSILVFVVAVTQLDLSLAANLSVTVRTRGPVARLSCSPAFSAVGDGLPSTPSAPDPETA
jgi:hypothetical protein